MTAETDLLPLPSVLLNWPHPTNHVAIRNYARANVEHHTVLLQAEIEALRVEVAAQRTRADAMAGEAIKHEDRAERLERGLRYAVRVWVLSDEIEWSEEEIDAAVERIIDSAKKEADRG